MTDMPVKSHLTSGSTTEAQFQSAIGDFYDVVNQLGLLGAPQQIQITSGSITPSKCDITLDTENIAASDILDTIVPTNITEKIIFIRNKSAARPITVSHLAAGTGKINLSTQADTILRDPRYIIALKWDINSSQWIEYWRNFGVFVASGDEATIRTQLGLGTASTRDTGILTGQIPLRENLGSAAFVNTGVSSGQVPLSNQLGSLAFKSLISNAEMDGSGVAPGTYSSVTVNAQGRVTAGGGLAQGPVKRVYLTNSSWAKPAGLSYVEVAVLASGGSGASASVNGNNGSNSSFGAFCVATGGLGGTPTGSIGGGIGGVGTVGDYLTRGNNGGGGSGPTPYSSGGDSADISLFITKGLGSVSSNSYVAPTGLGSGSGGFSAGGGGGGGGAAYRRISAADITDTIAITVGLAATGPFGNPSTSGQVIVWEYY